MPSTLLALESIRRLLGLAFVAAGAVLLVVCLIDWLVRSRRLNPFGGVARFFRQSVEPLMAPVERQVVRAGGNPALAPFWALAVVALAGIVFLSLFDFVREQLANLSFASQTGPRGILRIMISWTFALLRLAIIVRIVCSWVRISPYSRWVRWSFVLSEPILSPLRRVIPLLGMIDVSPIVAYLLLGVLERLLLGLT